MCSEVNTGIVQSSRRTTTKFSTVLHVLVLELYRQIYLQVVPLCNSIYKSNKITIWGWLIRGSISKVIVPGKVLQGTGTCTKNILVLEIYGIIYNIRRYIFERCRVCMGLLARYFMDKYFPPLSINQCRAAKSRSGP